MKAIIDLTTKKVKGFDREKGLFEFEIEIFDINPEKIINNKVYTLLENPSVFDFDEIIEAKGKKIIEDNAMKYAILNEELNENDLNLENPNHSAHTGFKFLQLKPNGECITNLIVLPEESTLLKGYLESEDGVTTEFSSNGEDFEPLNDSIQLEQPINQIYLKFINTSDQPKQIFSYGILV